MLKYHIKTELDDIHMAYHFEEPMDMGDHKGFKITGSRIEIFTICLN